MTAETREVAQVPGPIARPSVIPYVVHWEHETPGLERDLVVDATHSPPRLAYRDERPEDRDRAGVLRARVRSLPGVGRADYAYMNPVRQYECMYGLKCQVSGEQVGRTAEGYLFIVWRQADDGPDWPEGALTNQPPLCEEHARLALKECPHLTDGEPLAVRSRVPKLWGVSGIMYRVTEAGWESYDGMPPLKYGDERLHGMVASHLYRKLLKVTVVDL